MSSAKLWKSVAGVTGALALVLGGAGVAGATAATPNGVQLSHGSAHATTADESPVPDCHSAEHAGFGMLVNCKNQHKG